MATESGDGLGMTGDHVTRSTRNQGDTTERLQRWLGSRLAPGSDPVLRDVVSPETNGMSSETLLFSAQWNEGGDPVERRCVARIEPPATDVPVFPTYDLDLQYRVMELVGEATDVPVPETLWYEGDLAVLGAPFFVMARVDGDVPPDVMPYTFGDNWLYDSSSADQQALQRSAVETLAGIHAITPATHDLDFLQYDKPGASSLERHFAHWQDYHDWVVQDQPSALLSECFAWLTEHFPSDPSPDALSWGDSRIGNMMFAGTEVVAVLDWEMAAVAPPEVDAGWMTYLHMFFQDLTESMGAPGMPDLFRASDVRDAYAAASGRQLADLRWFIAYAAMRHGVIMRRVTERSVFFGEAERPDDIDDLILHRATLAGMLDGSYWQTRGL